MVAGGQGWAVAFEPRALHGRTILRQGPRLGQAGRRVDGLPFRRPACESQIHWPPVTGHCPYSLTTHYLPLATCHPPYPTPSSATRNGVRFECMICY